MTPSSQIPSRQEAESGARRYGGKIGRSPARPRIGSCANGAARGNKPLLSWQTSKLLRIQDCAQHFRRGILSYVLTVGVRNWAMGESQDPQLIPQGRGTGEPRGQNRSTPKKRGPSEDGPFEGREKSLLDRQVHARRRHHAAGLEDDRLVAAAYGGGYLDRELVEAGEA